jgi:hypothetical protein
MVGLLQDSSLLSYHSLDWAKKENLKSRIEKT